MTRFYLQHILRPAFNFAWLHVPWFADYCVEFVKQVQRKVHGKLLTPDYIEQVREALSKQ